MREMFLIIILPASSWTCEPASLYRHNWLDACRQNRQASRYTIASDSRSTGKAAASLARNQRGGKAFKRNKVLVVDKTRREESIIDTRGIDCDNVCVATLGSIIKQDLKNTRPNYYD